MSINNFKWIRKIIAQEESNSSKMYAIKRDLKLFLLVFNNRQIISDFRHPPLGSSLEFLMQKRPQTVGAIIWPYQCAAWDAKTRLNNIKNHCSVLDKLGKPLTMPTDARLILLDLEDISEGLKIVLDQPKWLAKEGLFSICIFLGNFRAFSLAFSFMKNKDGKVDCYIGGLQGRNRKSILETYKVLTKVLCGLRPRDFLFEMFRTFCRYYKINTIYAVADEYRFHRHPYFSKTDFHLNYNDVWKDRGGERISKCFFKIAVTPERKDLSIIKSKKRNIYKKRYELLDDLEEKFRSGIENSLPIYFQDS